MSLFIENQPLIAAAVAVRICPSPAAARLPAKAARPGGPSTALAAGGQRGTRPAAPLRCAPGPVSRLWGGCPPAGRLLRARGGTQAVRSAHCASTGKNKKEYREKQGGVGTRGVRGSSDSPPAPCGVPPAKPAGAVHLSLRPRHACARREAVAVDKSPESLGTASSPAAGLSDTQPRRRQRGQQRPGSPDRRRQRTVHRTTPHRTAPHAASLRETA